MRVLHRQISDIAIERPGNIYTPTRYPWELWAEASVKANSAIQLTQGDDFQGTVGAFTTNAHSKFRKAGYRIKTRTGDGYVIVQCWPLEQESE
jgi:hypothetical protein